MKTKLHEDRLYTTYLLNGNGSPRLEVHQKDGAKPTAVLEPNDYVPGLEPSSGITAASFLAGVVGFIQDEKLNSLKPKVRRQVEKFMKAGPAKIESKAEQQVRELREKIRKFESAALNIYEACAALNIIVSSDETHEDLLPALNFIAPNIIKNSKILHEIVMTS